MRRFLGLLLIGCYLPLVPACAGATTARGMPIVRLNDLRPLPPTPPAEVVPLLVAVAFRGKLPERHIMGALNCEFHALSEMGIQEMAITET